MTDKIYVLKSRPNQSQEFPVPEDIENWHELDFDPDFDYRGKTYDVSLNAFIDTPLALEEILRLRKIAYKEESDPLFMEWQFDQTADSEQVWREKVSEIKLRHPLPS